jgi:hypothetical protein
MPHTIGAMHSRTARSDGHYQVLSDPRSKRQRGDRNVAPPVLSANKP